MSKRYTIRVAVAQVPAVQIVDVPEEGIELGDIPGYNPDFGYIVEGQAAREDTVIRPGVTVVGHPPHEDGGQ